MASSLRDRLPADAIICNGAGNFSIWILRYYRFRGITSQLAPTSGSMGYGVPAAIMAKRQHPDRIAVALDGCLMDHHRFLLRLQIRRLDEIDRHLAAVEARIAEVMQPFASQRSRLTQIPGVEDLTAASIIAEIGTDMAVFGSARRLAAWAGVCPANHESAGQAKRRGTRKGNVFLKTTLMTAAMGAARAKGTDFRDKFHRLKARLGAKKADMAIAHKILVAVFHILARTVSFQELGADDLDRRHKHRIAKRRVRRLDALGYAVMLQPKSAD